MSAGGGQDSGLVNQLLSDILKNQQDNAQTLGRIDQSVKDLKDNTDEIKQTYNALSARVSKLEKRDIKRGGMIAGVLFCIEIAFQYFKRKMGW